MFQKDMTVSLLLDFYGDILNERRREIMEMYYNEDLSLSEIADVAGISRQGVRDSIKKSERELSELENTLGLLARFQSLKSEITRISSLLDAVIGKSGADVKAELGEIKAEIEKLEL